MTRKDFEALAAIIAAAMKEAPSMADPQTALAFVANRTADHCQTRNQHFDRARFLAACGVAS